MHKLFHQNMTANNHSLSCEFKTISNYPSNFAEAWIIVRGVHPTTDYFLFLTHF